MWLPTRLDYLLSGLLGLCCLSGCSLAKATQYGIVIGIDHYQQGSNERNPPKGKLKNLDGAVNDALYIAKSLKKAGVKLPESHILIDKQATLDAFKQVWSSTLAKSAPGDTIVLTFAGHGGQEKEAGKPYDESEDGFDETLMFWDFNPKKPYLGRLSDDEFFLMLENASDRNITVVADSCHSAGLTRSIDKNVGRTRTNGDVFDLGSDELDDLDFDVLTEGDEGKFLAHVTYLTGTKKESVEVREIIRKEDGEAHGALSVSFADGVAGAADFNQDNKLSRRELESYVGMRVQDLTQHKQAIGFTPLGGSYDKEPVLNIGKVEYTPPVANDLLAVKFEGAPFPSGLKNAKASDTANLVFTVDHGNITAYYGTDELKRWRSSVNSYKSMQLYQSLVDKFRLLNKLSSSGYNATQMPLSVSIAQCEHHDRLGHCDYEHSKGSEITMEFDKRQASDESVANGDYFVLFNLAGSGIVQYQYPLKEFNDKPVLASLPYSLPFEVDDPVGRDDMVAVFCQSNPVKLKQILSKHHGLNAPDPGSIMPLLKEADCQVRSLPLFTKE